MAFVLALLALIIGAPSHADGSGPPPTHQAGHAAKASPKSIGVATQEPDGTIVLTLRATTAGGLIGDARLRYAPSNPHYQEIAKHVGPIPHGGSVPVAAFDRK